MSLKKKRQYTETLYRVNRKGGSGMYVGLIYRKSKGRSFDVIEVEIVGHGGHVVAFWMSPDEAAELSTALSYAVENFLIQFRPYRRFRSKGSVTAKVWREGGEIE